MKVYTLFSNSTGSKPTNKVGEYRHGMWIVKIRAISIRQAISMYYAQYVAKNGIGIGITSIDASEPRQWTWREIPKNKPLWLSCNPSQVVI